LSTLPIRTETALRALASRLQAAGRDDRPVRRLLIAHYLLLGDTVLLAPLMKRLASLYPDAERVVLARPSVAVLFDGRPYGFRCIPFHRRDAASRRRVLASGPYDLAIVPDDNRYAWLARAAGARRVVAFADDVPRWKNWMVDVPVAYPDRPQAWADAAAERLADGGDAVVVEPFRDGEWPAPATLPVARPEGPYVVIHVGASTPLKQWPPERWRALADRWAQRMTIVWSAGPDERTIIDAVGIREGEWDVAGKLDLAQLWSLLRGARLLVCPDTGVAHLARIVGVPTVALFGPASRVVHGPGAFWARAPFRLVTEPDVVCRNQSTLFRREVAWVRRCGRRYDAQALPRGASDPTACGRALCMEDVALDAVVAATESLLAETSARAVSRDDRP